MFSVYTLDNNVVPLTSCVHGRGRPDVVEVRVALRQRSDLEHDLIVCQLLSQLCFCRLKQTAEYSSSGKFHTTAAQVCNRLLAIVNRGGNVFSSVICVPMLISA